MSVVENILDRLDRLEAQEAIGNTSSSPETSPRRPRTATLYLVVGTVAGHQIKKRGKSYLVKRFPL